MASWDLAGTGDLSPETSLPRSLIPLPHLVFQFCFLFFVIYLFIFSFGCSGNRKKMKLKILWLNFTNYDPISCLLRASPFP